jgi:hypothetical protein
MTVQRDGCYKVTQYPEYWDTRHVCLHTTTPGSYPVPFTASNSCAGGSGSGTFTGDWQKLSAGNTSASCPTVIDLQGAAGATVRLRWGWPEEQCGL